MRADDTVTEDPCFGSISFNRTQSSGTYLFGSATKHSGFVTLSVSTAESIVNNFTKEMRLFPRKQIVQVHLTEAQFAELISRWGTGEGVPCTLARRPKDGYELVGYDAPKPDKTTRETYNSIIDDAVKTTQARINETADEIQALVKDRLPKKDAEKLRHLIDILKVHPQSNLRFAQTLLHESLEKMLARGKLEMEAAGRSLLDRLGLAKLGEEARKLLPSHDLTDE